MGPPGGCRLKSAVVMNVVVTSGEIRAEEKSARAHDRCALPAGPETAPAPHGLAGCLDWHGGWLCDWGRGFLSALSVVHGRARKDAHCSGGKPGAGSAAASAGHQLRTGTGH